MRRFMTKTAIAAVLLAGCTSVKQYPEATRDELWVKMELVDGTTYRGALLEYGDDSLMLVVWDEPEPDVTVAVSQVARVELYRGQLTSLEGVLERTGEEVAIGAAAGTAGGLILGALLGSPGEGAKAGLGIGVGAGLWGGVYNGIYEGEDHWEEVSMESLRHVYCALKSTPACGYMEATGA
jgi:hypothetical protein